MTKEIGTYANGYGVWHATVPLEYPGDHHKAAAAAIRASLADRENLDPHYRVRVREVCQVTYADGGRGTLFVER